MPVPHLIAGFGVVLLFIASVYHAIELRALDGSFGPVAALVVDGVPALGIIFAGYWLADSDLPSAELDTIWWRTLIGAVVIGGAFFATVLVRQYESRAVTEPVFPLLVAIEVGALAGFLTSYYYAQARVDAQQAEAVTDALRFVNKLIRHDLRNDLSVIASRSELLRTQLDIDDTDIESPHLVVEKADEAIERIETTEAITKTLVGTADFEPIDLTSITAEVADRLDETHPIDVRTDLPETALVYANAGLQSVVDNLLENAVEHNDADDPYVEITITVADDAVWLTIRDNGPGIPNDRRRTLFESDVDTGDGGLALVGTLVDMYDGEIWIEANEPRGTVVTVELPLADDQD
ncbi:Signal-transducing histidine kinase protein [Halorhabdus tiamatea SARL4B]|uniref:histidine kinase n=1 Tax=Halorhabdus tiamatea SARL4B TaxID=1033806 RepID=U2DY81_9EURY|nr:Signal-transducing histidine kinase protein [Halorhabdus tiamatea SARL4B]